MRPCILFLTLLLVLAGCKPEDTPAALQLVRTLADPKSIDEDRHAIGVIKPRHEGKFAFRVGGNAICRLVDVDGANLAVRRSHQLVL